MQGKQQKAEWYDMVYNPAIESNYICHYIRSGYYPSWSIIADRLLRYANGQQLAILDIGCGVGQFAHMLWDKGIRNYTGIDFSGVAIGEARKRCPEFNFIHADAKASDCISQHYPIVTCLEFLEHIEGDLELLARIPSGTRIYATVPNFNHDSHVRSFRNAAAVRARYGLLLDDMSIYEMPVTRKHLHLFIVEGVRV